MDSSEIKKIIGRNVIDTLVTDGMKLGMGTGSTALEAMKRLKERLEEGSLKNVFLVPTSAQTEIECREFGFNIYSLNDPAINGELDLTIDGADEVNPDWHLIKGGGGALLLEKIVACYSRKYAIIVDETKMVKALGPGFLVPLEVNQAALLPVTRKLKSLGVEVKLRMALRQAGPVITKCGNLLLDLAFHREVDPREMEITLKMIPGVVDSGLFTLPVTDLFVGYRDGRVEHLVK